MYINVVFCLVISRGYNHDNRLKWLSHVIMVRVQDKQLLTTNITNHGCIHGIHIYLSNMEYDQINEILTWFSGKKVGEMKTKSHAHI
jgi:hypothetical protein